MAYRPHAPSVRTHFFFDLERAAEPGAQLPAGQMLGVRIGSPLVHLALLFHQRHASHRAVSASLAFHPSPSLQVLQSSSFCHPINQHFVREAQVDRTGRSGIVLGPSCSLRDRAIEDSMSVIASALQEFAIVALRGLIRGYTPTRMSQGCGAPMSERHLQVGVET